MCYTERDAMIDHIFLLENDSENVPITAPYSFVDQLNTARRFMWNKATKTSALWIQHHIFLSDVLLWWFLLVSTSQKRSTIASSSVLRVKS